MGRIHRLSDLKARKTDRNLCDGGGLWLIVSRTGAKHWTFKSMTNGRSREMGLGGFPIVSLAEARVARDQARKLLRGGLDPIDERRRAKMQASQAQENTFECVAQNYIEIQAPGWRSAKATREWHSLMKTYVYPTLGDLPIATIESDHIKRVLDPIWHVQPSTASRLRGRLEAILDFATSRKLRTGPNPATWKGNLKGMLSKQKLAHNHHAALPFTEVGKFLEVLRQDMGGSARALELIVLTAVRAGEARLAQFSEFDLAQRLWIIPATRTKTQEEHRVPLSDAAMAIIQAMADESRPGATFVFPGARPNRPFTELTFHYALKRIGYSHITTHGFRSTFRDWCAETTDYPRDVAEMALAHKVANQVERAYRRGDLLEKRRRLMQDWADFCIGHSRKGEVVAFPSSR